jgi:hypothetical protein
MSTVIAAINGVLPRFATEADARVYAANQQPDAPFMAVLDGQLTLMSTLGDILWEIETGDSGQANIASAALALAQDALNAAEHAALTAYPVGAIYLSANNTNPGTLFGGTWIEVGKGRTLVGVDTGDTDFNTPGKTGGVKSVTLTAAQSGLPAHSHAQPAHTHTVPALSGSTDSQGSHEHQVVFRNTNDSGQAMIGQTGSGLTPYWGITPDTTTGNALRRMVASSAGAHTHTVTTKAGVTGSAQPSINANTATNAASAHTNLQPYLTTYIWQRTE